MSITGAAEAAGVSRPLLYRWYGTDAAFAADWDDAARRAADRLEDEALRRAMEGVEKPVFHRGQQVGAVRTYNDRMLLALLQRRRPMPSARLGASSPGRNPGFLRGFDPLDIPAEELARRDAELARHLLGDGDLDRLDALAHAWAKAQDDETADPSPDARPEDADDDTAELVLPDDDNIADEPPPSTPARRDTCGAPPPPAPAAMPLVIGSREPAGPSLQVGPRRSSDAPARSAGS
jgi:AcrR family transcriptional regulator